MVNKELWRVTFVSLTEASLLSFILLSWCHSRETLEKLVVMAAPSRGHVLPARIKSINAIAMTVHNNTTLMMRFLILLLLLLLF